MCAQAEFNIHTYTQTHIHTDERITFASNVFTQVCGKFINLVTSG